MALVEYVDIEGTHGELEAEGVVSDKDGTLVGGYESVCAQLRAQILGERGFVCPNEEELRGQTGKGILELIVTAQEGENGVRLKNEWPEIVGDFERRLALQRVSLEIFPDAAEFFNGHALPAAIATNARRGGLEARLLANPHVGLWVTERFHTVVTLCCVDGRAKPDPAMVLEAQKRIQVSGNVLWVGDGLPDALAGSQAQLPTFILARDRSAAELAPIRKVPGVVVVKDFTGLKVRKN